MPQELHSYATDRDFYINPFGVGENHESSRPTRRYVMDGCIPLMTEADAEQEFEDDLDATTEQAEDELFPMFGD